MERSLRRLTAIRVLVAASMVLPYILLYQPVWTQVSEPSEDLLPPATVQAESSVATLEEESPDTRRLTVFRHLVAIVSVQTLLYIVLMRVLAHRPTLQAYVQFLGDLLLISYVLYALGDAGSFSILYFVVISVASVLLRRSAGVIVATIAYVLYASVTLGIAQNLIAAGLRGEPPEAFVRSSAVPLTYDLVVHFLGFYAVAFFTSYLARDISRAEEELAEKHLDLQRLQVLYRDVVQSITSGLVTSDLRGRITSVNRAAEEILRRREEELVGRHLAATGMIDADEFRSTSESLTESGRRLRDEVLVEGPTTKQVLGYTLTLLRDGESRPQGFILVFQDLTEWRSLQERLRIQDRMATIGEMAASLAHEVGNPLAAISGSVQMMASSLPDDASQQKLLQITLRESHRLDRTVKGFLQFARPRERSVVPFDVQKLLTEETELLRNEEDVRSGRIRIEFSAFPDSAEIVADPDQVSQVFWNLVRNALKAMPDGGTLTVRSRLEAGRGYFLEIEDTGVGMGPEERERLFHPFRSFFDDGTGIGMAIVYRIVQEHQGELDVQSAPGRGTKVSVRLPEAAPEAPEEANDGRLSLP